MIFITTFGAEEELFVFMGGKTEAHKNEEPFLNLLRPLL